MPDIGSGPTVLTGADPGSSSFAVTPSNTTDFTTEARSLYVGGAGTVRVVNPDDSTTDWVMPAGSYITTKVKRVNSTGTTATSIVGIL